MNIWLLKSVEGVGMSGPFTPTPTAIARVVFWRVFLFFTHDISKNDAAWIAKIYVQKSSMMGLVLETDLFWCQKVNVCVGLQTECNIDAGCVRKPRRVFPLRGFLHSGECRRLLVLRFCVQDCLCRSATHSAAFDVRNLSSCRSVCHYMR